MINIMKQGLGLRTPQQERFGNSQELKSFGGGTGLEQHGHAAGGAAERSCASK